MDKEIIDVLNNTQNLSPEDLAMHTALAAIWNMGHVTRQLALAKHDAKDTGDAGPFVETMRTFGQTPLPFTAAYRQNILPMLDKLSAANDGHYGKYLVQGTAYQLAHEAAGVWLISAHMFAARYAERGDAGESSSIEALGEAWSGIIALQGIDTSLSQQLTTAVRAEHARLIAWTASNAGASTTSTPAGTHDDPDAGEWVGPMSKSEMARRLSMRSDTRAGYIDGKFSESQMRMATGKTNLHDFNISHLTAAEQKRARRPRPKGGKSEHK